VVRGLLVATHAGPALAVTVVATLLAVTAGVSAPRVVLVCAAVLAGQASIGWSNDWLAADLFECECGETAIGRTGESKARASMLTQVGGGSDALPALLREDSPAGDAMRARLGLVYRHSAERVLVDGELVRARRLESSWEAL
jgi:hypothetical protein